MSNQPSAAFRRHHDVEAPRIDARSFRQGWRITSRLDALLRDGRLTAGEWQAAVEYRAAWERVLVATGGGSILAAQLCGCGGGGGVADRLASIADTVTRLRTVHAAIGAFPQLLCVACVVEDCTWVATGQLLRCDRETARDRTVAAIRLLAGAWSSATRRQAPRLATGQRPAPTRRVAASVRLQTSASTLTHDPCPTPQERVING